MRDWKTFTPEELKELRNNPYVKSATEKMVRFTVAFKEEFWRRYNDECQRPAQIMQALGFDVDVLGDRRISGILLHIREQAESGEGFRDVRKIPKGQGKTDEQLPPSKAILKIQHRISYLEQEMEFIKKNIIADNKAKRKN